MNKVFCYMCSNRYCIDSKVKQYVEPQTWDSLCVATDKPILCKERNPDGNCKLYKELAECDCFG